MQNIPQAMITYFLSLSSFTLRSLRSLRFILSISTSVATVLNLIPLIKICTTLRRTRQCPVPTDIA